MKSRIHIVLRNKTVLHTKTMNVSLRNYLIESLKGVDGNITQELLDGLLVYEFKTITDVDLLIKDHLASTSTLLTKDQVLSEYGVGIATLLIDDIPKKDALLIMSWAEGFDPSEFILVDFYTNYEKSMRKKQQAERMKVIIKSKARTRLEMVRQTLSDLRIEHDALKLEIKEFKDQVKEFKTEKAAQSKALKELEKDWELEKSVYVKIDKDKDLLISKLQTDIQKLQVKKKPQPKKALKK